MSLGHQKQQHQEMWVATSELPKSPGHVFYRKLNALLAQGGFDRFVEELCRPYYAEGRGRPSIPPGQYFRMLLVGYFEGLGSQRGIAWRCSDSLSLREFLGVAPMERAPDHSSLTRVRDRLPEEVHVEVFRFVLQMAETHGLLKGKTVGVDSTTLEANAAMKSIVRRETGEDWKEYVTRLMREEGVIAEDHQPSDDEIRRFDKNRKGKKVSNEEWASETDPDSRIAKMKDDRTHLAYKSEHVVDLETDLILAAEVYHADQGDTHTLEDSLLEAQTHLCESGSDAEIEEVAADSGYHAAGTLANLAEYTPYRTYIPEPKRRHKRRWTDKPEVQRVAVLNNRRRLKRDKSKRLQRRRSELVERSFAHMCRTGGARRTWLRGIEKVRKRYLLTAVAHNLGLILRGLCGMGTARGLQAAGGLILFLYALYLAIKTILAAPDRFRTIWALPSTKPPAHLNMRPHIKFTTPKRKTAAFSTGC